MNQKTMEFREKITQSFIHCLQTEPLNWKKQWSVPNSSNIPINAVTGAKYKGINRLWLSHLANISGLKDPRWATFKQIQDKGWKLEKGAKGEQVEYWSAYDFSKKKNITWEEYNKAHGNPLTKNDVGIISKQFYVFNAKNITGIPELTKPVENNISSDQLISLISKNMNVPIIHDGGDGAFYRPSEDKIHLPTKESFHSNYAYNAVALHELSHATGAAHRLNRDIRNLFGSPKYAFEELVAEMSSCFMSTNLQLEQSPEHLKNHQAYIQSWIKDITEKPNILIQAIKEADKAANFLEYQAELVTEAEYKQTLQQSREVGTDEIKEKNTVLRSTNVIKDVPEFKVDLKEIRREIKEYGFKCTKKLTDDISVLNLALSKNHTMKDLYNLYKKPELLETSIKDTVFSIINNFQVQESKLINSIECER